MDTRYKIIMAVRNLKNENLNVSVAGEYFSGEGWEPDRPRYNGKVMDWTKKGLGIIKIKFEALHHRLCMARYKAVKNYRNPPKIDKLNEYMYPIAKCSKDGTLTWHKHWLQVGHDLDIIIRKQITDVHTQQIQKERKEANEKKNAK